VQVLLFRAADALYALPCAVVHEVVPRVAARRIDLAPEWVVGLVLWRGEKLPVVDLVQRLVGRPSADRLDSRIAVVRFAPRGATERPLGLLAERVSTIGHLDPKTAYDGVKIPETPFLGSLVRVGDEIVHLVRVDELVPPETADLLYADVT
jgi:chemotaxis-related protein WspB